MDQQTLLATLDRLRAMPAETNWLEFKTNWDRHTDIAQYLSALGNSALLEGADRGWLVWGVDDKTHQVVSTSFDPSMAKGEGHQPLQMWLTQKISPKPEFTFHKLDHPDGKVVMLEIFPPRTAPLTFDSNRYIRIDSHKVSLSTLPDKEARLWAALGQKDDWSGEVVADATVDDLDPEAIAAARQRYTEYMIKSEPDVGRHEQIARDAASWDVTTLLNKARITKGGRITRSAILLLGRDESAHLLSPVDAKISWILRDSANRMVSSQHFGMPFLLSTEKVFARIRNVTIEHMPDGTLFPTAIPQYDVWVIREALHNCVAHQDYRLGGKINVVELPDKLVFSNLGNFTPPSIEWMLINQSPPEHYRNQWLIDGMIRLRMIDQAGSGIRRMYETQRGRFFPLPDYDIGTAESGLPRVEVGITGQILDTKYTQVLMKLRDLELNEVLLLDRLQKHQELSKSQVQELKARKLIEGRSPNYFISAKVADLTNQKALYIHNRGLDESYYRQLITDYLQQYGGASRKDIDELLIPKLPEVLDAGQKAHKIRNLLQLMRKDNLIYREGARATPVWRLVTAKT